LAATSLNEDYQVGLPSSGGGGKYRCPEWSECEVEDVLENYGELLAGCYERAKPPPPPSQGITFDLRATVHRDGGVVEVEVDALAPDYEDLSSCLEDAVREMAFPLETLDTTTYVEVPVRLIKLTSG